MAAVRSLLLHAAGPVVLVPTMGALHHGHAALIKHARKLAGKSGMVVVSIFVNPLQFAPKEDLAAYPRPLSKDKAICKSLGVDVVFLPSVESLIPADASVYVDEGGLLSSVLCGRSRPGHFKGVCTIVAKLFNIIQPKSAVFGEKDWQQLAIIRRMVRDLNFPVKVIGYPIVREADGLAVSSRNAYLSAQERALAPRFYEALQFAVEKYSTPEAIVREAVSRIQSIPGTRVDYVEVVDSSTLQPVKKLKAETMLAAAIFLGRTRLIDNIQITRL